MRFKNHTRIQNESYSSISELIADAIETVMDEQNDERKTNIISSRQITEDFLDYINKSELDFKFDEPLTNYKDGNDEYMLTICDDGEVYVDPTTDKNGEYYDLDGFIYVHNDVNLDILNGNNRRCDVIIYSVDEA